MPNIDPTSSVTAIQQRAVAELLRISPIADALGNAFSGAGHEIALVGGSVRDALLGRLGVDLDFATSAHPEQTERLLGPLADAVWDIGREFGTIGARFGDVTCEVTTYRTEMYERESRKPGVRYGDTLIGDLGRRDFTVNAMAVQVARSEICRWLWWSRRSRCAKVDDSREPARFTR